MVGECVSEIMFLFIVCSMCGGEYVIILLIGVELL